MRIRGGRGFPFHRLGPGRQDWQVQRAEGRKAEETTAGTALLVHGAFIRRL